MSFWQLLWNKFGKTNFCPDSSGRSCLHDNYMVTLPSVKAVDIIKVNSISSNKSRLKRIWKFLNLKIFENSCRNIVLKRTQSFSSSCNSSFYKVISILVFRRINEFQILTIEEETMWWEIYLFLCLLKNKITRAATKMKLQLHFNNEE